MTDRDDASSGARLRESLLRAALNAAPSAIAVICDGSIAFANGAFADLFGPADLRTLGAPLGPLLRTFCIQSGPVTDARRLEARVSVPGVQGQTAIEVTARSVLIDGRGCHIVVARALAPRAPRDAGQGVTEQLASVGRLAQGVLHDIRNPLAYVLGSIEVAERGLRASESAADSGILEAITNARRGVERLRTIVEDLLPFSRPTMTEAPLPTHLESLLDSSIKVAWNELRHRARVVKRYGGVAPVIADESRLGHAFVQLLVNAARAIEGAGAADAELVLTTRDDAERVLVEFASAAAAAAPDDGDPWSLSAADDGKDARTAAHRASLALCRDIVAAQGGELSVESSEQGGVLFRVALPRAKPDGGVARENPEAAEPGGGARILIIDDEPLLGQTLSFAFAGRHDIVVTASGREALALLASDTRFDLVLCDLMMPDVSGQKVFESLSGSHPELLPRFVFMSGGAFTESAQDFLEQYPGRRIEKPFTMAQIERLLLNLPVEQ